MQENEISQIAQQASSARSAGDEEKVHELFKRLHECRLFSTVAKRLFCHFGRPTRTSPDDIEQELTIHCYRNIDGYTIKKGNVFGWLSTVGHHLLVSSFRLRSSSEQPCLDYDSEIESGQDSVETTFEQRELEAALKNPFSDDDWQRISGWRDRNARDPIVVILVGGLEKKIGEKHKTDWQSWLEDVGIDAPEKLMNDIKQIDIDNEIGRIERLRSEFDLSRNSLWQDWNRKRHLIVELDFFWESLCCDFKKFISEEHEALIKLDGLSRVSILCVDRHWPRSGGAWNWNEYAKGYPFKGIPPLLRFLQLQDFDERISLLESATSTRRVISISDISAKLLIGETFQLRDKLNESSTVY